MGLVTSQALAWVACPIWPAHLMAALVRFISEDQIASCWPCQCSFTVYRFSQTLVESVCPCVEMVPLCSESSSSHLSPFPLLSPSLILPLHPHPLFSHSSPSCLLDPPPPTLSLSLSSPPPSVGQRRMCAGLPRGRTWPHCIPRVWLFGEVKSLRG